MKRCPLCHSSRWVREVVNLEYIDGMDRIVRIEERAEIGVLKCVVCSYAGKPEEVYDEEEG